MKQLLIEKFKDTGGGSKWELFEEDEEDMEVPPKETDSTTKNDN